jgi:6,7-dimethyl-8-ribityllumazine synthase
MAKARRRPSKREKTRILLVESRYYDGISAALLEGAMNALDEAGVDVERVTVPGSLEIPTAIAFALDAAQLRRKPYDGVVALGCVIRGDTLHFEIVSKESARALTDLALARRIPIGNGILTVNNESQAWARSAITEGNKGGEAARAALTLVQLKRMLAGR